MLTYLKISSYVLALYLSFKFRVYIEKNWFKKDENTRNDHIESDKHLVLFFPEKEISLKDCYLKNNAFLTNDSKNSSLAQLLLVLKSAKRSLNICMYSLSFEPIIKLCEELRVKNDIIIRIIIDGKHNRVKTFLSVEQNGTQKLNRLKKLLHFGIELKIVSLKEEGLMHHKFAIIDDCLLINGSLNWTENAIFHSYNDVMITTEQMLVFTYLNKFNKLWSKPSH